MILSPGLKQQMKDSDLVKFFSTPEDIMLMARKNPTKAQYLYFKWLTNYDRKL